MGIVSTVSRASLKSLTLAPAIAMPNGIPWPSVSRLFLVPRLARSVGLGPVFFPTQRRLTHRAVECQPTPVDRHQPIISEQPLTPELPEHAGLCPFLKPPMGRGMGTDASRIQGLPLTAGAQHEEDRIHRGTIRNTRAMAAQRVNRSWRKQSLDLLPEFIRHPPAVVFVCCFPGVYRESPVMADGIRRGGTGLAGGWGQVSRSGERRIVGRRPGWRLGGVDFLGL